eukprot:SAG11_NODE_1153_length_5662_cov_51.111810_2_plen_158_part_00
MELVRPTPRALLPVALLLSLCSRCPRPALGTSNGLSRSPALGWNSWNWVGVNRFGPSCPPKLGCHSDAVMREMADAVVASGLRDKGYEYINLSEGWPLGPNQRFPNGTIRWDPERYPFGIRALADYILSKVGVTLTAILPRRSVTRLPAGEAQTRVL